MTTKRKPLATKPKTRAIATTKTKPKKGLSGIYDIPKEAAYYAKKNFGNDINGNPRMSLEIYDKSGILIKVIIYSYYGNFLLKGLIQIGISGYITKGYKEYKNLYDKYTL